MTRLHDLMVLAGGLPRRPRRRRRIALVIEGEGRALVIEDQDDAREILVAHLEALGYEVRAAAGVIGALAIGAGLDWVPDLVVTDLHMPRFDGLTAVRLIRRASAFPSMPVVVVSGVYTRDDPTGVISDLISEGAVFITKGDRLAQQLPQAIQDAKALALTTPGGSRHGTGG